MKFSYVGLHILLNGISTPVLKKLGEIMPIYPIILIRGILALGIFSRIKNERKKLNRRSSMRYILLIVLSIIGYFSYYTALNLVDVGLIAIFTINVTMLFTLILSTLVLKEKFSGIQWFLIFVSLISLTLLTYEGMRLEFNIGILLLVINSIVNSVGAIITRRLLEERYGNEVSSVRTSIDVALSALMIVVTPTIISEFMDKITVLIGIIIVYLAFNSVILATLYNKSIILLGVGLTDILRNFTVVVTILIGVLFMDETYSLLEVGYLALFILATFAIIVVGKRSEIKQKV